MPQYIHQHHICLCCNLRFNRSAYCNDARVIQFAMHFSVYLIWSDAKHITEKLSAMFKKLENLNALIRCSQSSPIAKSIQLASFRCTAWYFHFIMSRVAIANFSFLKRKILRRLGRCKNACAHTQQLGAHSELRRSFASWKLQMMTSIYISVHMHAHRQPIHLPDIVFFFYKHERNIEKEMKWNRGQSDFFFLIIVFH